MSHFIKVCTVCLDKIAIFREIQYFSDLSQYTTRHSYFAVFNFIENFIDLIRIKVRQRFTKSWEFFKSSNWLKNNDSMPILHGFTIMQLSIVVACKCSKIWNTFLFLFSNKVLVNYQGLVVIHKMLVRNSYREDSDQTATIELFKYGNASLKSSLICVCDACLGFFGRQLVFEF